MFNSWKLYAIPVTVHNAEFDGSKMRPYITWEKGNVDPLAVALFPVQPQEAIGTAEARYCPVIGGVAKCSPQANDVVVEFASFSPTAKSAIQKGPLLEWPEGAKFAGIQALIRSATHPDANIFVKAISKLLNAFRAAPTGLPTEQEVREAIATMICDDGLTLTGGVIEKPDASPGETRAAAAAKPNADRFVFALASCQYPSGLIDEEPAQRSIRQCGELSGSQKPDLLVLAGDQIYLDATAGLFDPVRVDVTRADAYAWAQGRYAAFATIPVCTMIDDHEIVDNWEPRPESDPHWKENEKLLERSCVAYVENCRTAGVPGAVARYTRGQPLSYPFEPAGFPHRFFFADTRTTRQLRNALTLTTAKIIGDDQWLSLQQWMACVPNDAVKFIVSPPILLPRQLATACQPMAALHSDAWDGYPASLHAMLAWLCDNDNGRTVFLSGDEHISCAATIEIARATDPQRKVTVYSVHSSALYAPYPFANGSEADLAGDEEFAFEAPDARGVPVRYVCKVSTFFPPADNGFAIVSVEPAGANLLLQVVFHACLAENPLQTRWSTQL